jgi:hypothetical protein
MALDPYAYVVKTRLIYGYYYEGELVYVGSSYLTLKELEVNHRECMTRFPADRKKQRRFRTALVNTDLKNGFFKVLYSCECTRPQIEALEGKTIRHLRPKYNDDMDPVGSSKYYERY